jgi:hypothetical protein
MFMHVWQWLRPNGMRLFMLAAVVPWLVTFAFYLLPISIQGKRILDFLSQWLPAAILLVCFSVMLLITIVYVFRDRKRALRLALATIASGLVPMLLWGLFTGPTPHFVGERLVVNGKGYFMTASSTFSEQLRSECSEDGRWLTPSGCGFSWFELHECNTLWILWIQCSTVADQIFVGGIRSAWQPNKIALRAADGAIQMVLTGLSSDGQPREEVLYTHQPTTKGFSLPLVLVLVVMGLVGSYLLKRGWDMEREKRKRLA